MTADINQQNNNTDFQLGKRISEFRKLRGMSLRELALMSGVSFSFLSQLEKGKTNVSVGSLRKIASALHITPSHLLDQNTVATPGVLKANQRPQIIDGPAKKWVLSSSAARGFEVYCGTFEPGASTGAEPYGHGDAQEIIIAVRGVITLQLGHEEYTLEAGDSIEFLSSISHRLVNRSEELAEVYWITGDTTNVALAAIHSRL
ncbi:helix-turn-helix domain-containing protein [Canibacter zhoujuaniae]|uniref:helix-turn-helix domain-containing protein n=1 Tax=Canibacter zhoujuaniae TaxID=2708343 RepID=UPI001FBB9E15|nr:XRE family transcriptional regulator [Canibacter zhoujuaniae]